MRLRAISPWPKYVHVLGDFEGTFEAREEMTCCQQDKAIENEGRVYQRRMHLRDPMLTLITDILLFKASKFMTVIAQQAPIAQIHNTWVALH